MKKLYYGLSILIILVVVMLGVFWTSSPQSVFFNAAVKKPDPPKKPSVAAPPPKNGTLQFGGGLKIPTREALMKDYNVKFVALQAARRAYAENPTVVTQVAVVNTRNAEKAAAKVISTASIAGTAAAKAAAAQDAYNKNPTDTNKSAATAAAKAEAAARLDLIKASVAEPVLLKPDKLLNYL